MVLVLIPDLTTLAKLVTEMAQEKVQVLVRLGELVSECVENLLDAWLCLRIRDLLLK